MIGIIGSGSWATAIVKILLERADRTLNWWVRNPDIAQSILLQGHNCKHLPSMPIDSARVNISQSLQQVVEQSTDLFLCIPSAFIAEVLSQLPSNALDGRNIISTIKGAIPETGSPVSAYLQQQFNIPPERICIASGPTHAEEVALGRPTFITIASRNQQLASHVEQMMQCHYLHTSHNTDIEGIERCGLIKNIYAIAAGICQGLGFGDNLAAVLTTAAMNEMRHVIDHCFPQPQRNFFDYCYAGDLLVTCWSPHSRNRTFGIAIANGQTPGTYLKQVGILPEGYYSLQIIHQLAVRMQTQHIIPIIETVYRILYEQASPQTEFSALIHNVL